MDVRIRDQRFPNADDHLLTENGFSRTTCLFSVHSFVKLIGTAIGYRLGHWTCVLVQAEKIYENLFQDLRYGARMLAKKPVFTVVAILTLALGVGANTAIFTVINAALLRPLPYEDAERLVVVDTTMRRETVEVRSTSYPDFVDWRDQNTAFERIAAYSSPSFNLTGGAEPERVDGELVSADYFPLLRARAAFGRTFLPEEDHAPDTHRVALVGYGLWQRRFGGDSALLGRTIQLNDGDYTVIGIMPEGFRGLSDEAEIWLPMMMVSSVRPVGNLRQRNQRWLSIIARLKPGVTMAQAQTEMDMVTRRLEQSYPDSNRNRGALVTTLQDRFFGGFRLTLWILLGAVVCVLLVACANVANLQLQWAAGRSSEMAVRLALGAGRKEVLGIVLADGMRLASVGVAIGLGVSFALTRLMAGLLFGVSASDPLTLGCVTLLLLAVALTACFIPARRATKVDPMAALRME